MVLVKTANQCRWMRGVDRSNQYLAYYRFEHKSRKWWRTIFTSLIDKSISNAFILYKCKNPSSNKCQLTIREDLISDLCKDFIEDPRTQNVPRIISGLHQMGIRNQKNCYICSTMSERKTSKFYCIQCDENICAVPCYYIMHTKTTLARKNKDRNTI